MVADLLAVERSAVHHDLVGLTDDWIKRLIAANVAGRSSKSKPYNL